MSFHPVLHVAGRMAALALVVMAPAIAAEAPINLSPERLAAAGVQFTPATAPDPQGGASLRLAGRVQVPGAGLELVLAPIDGRVESLLVDPGQPVRAGQPIARLYSAGLLSMQRGLVSARARTEAARARASRDAALHADGIIARNRLEESQAQLTEHEAELREQAQMLRLAGMAAGTVESMDSASDISPLLTLSARRDGHVLEQLAGVGQAVEAGAPLLRLARLDTLWIELQATREQAVQLHVGDAVQVTGCARPGKVIAAAMQLGAQSQTLQVRAELTAPDGCVTPNQFVEVQVAPRMRADGLVQVPAASVVRQQTRQYVFVKTAAGIEPREVTVERRSDQSAWIRGEVQAGDAVASAGIAALKGSWQGFGAAEEP